MEAASSKIQLGHLFIIFFMRACSVFFLVHNLFLCAPAAAHNNRQNGGQYYSVATISNKYIGALGSGGLTNVNLGLRVRGALWGLLGRSGAFAEASWRRLRCLARLKTSPRASQDVPRVFWERSGAFLERPKSDRELSKTAQVASKTRFW